MSQASAESRDGYAAMQDTGRETTQVKRILRHLCEVGPGTSSEVASGTGLTTYIVSKRRGLMLRQGLVQEQLPRRCKVTGMNASPIQIAEAGRCLLEGGEAPVAAPTRRDHESAVIRAAREVAEAWRPIPDPPAGVQKLLDAVWNLDNADARHRAGKTVEREPWGSPRRPALAAEGIWLRSNGDEVPMRDLTVHHLAGAVEWCERNGADRAMNPLAYLLMECARRNGAPT